jgi:outer membrane protein TolC
MQPHPLAGPAGLPARALALSLVLALSGCAGFSPDAGMDTVAALARERTGHAPRLVRDDAAQALVRVRVDELLAAPLGAEAAVELALLASPALQASLRELGIAEADLVAAGRLRNPVFGFLDVARGASYKIERSLGFDVLGLLTMPQRVAIERGRFEQAKLRAAAEAATLATQTRRAWVAAVASRQLVDYAAQVLDAAEASAELARRMSRAGNLSRLGQLREQGFQADAFAQHARARQQALADRERLIRLLGLPMDDPRLVLPDRLPGLPAAFAAAEQAESLALVRRLDLRAARLERDGLADSLGLASDTRLLDGAAVGLANLSEGHEPRRDGFALSLPLPIFDSGEARLVRARAQLEQAQARLAQAEVDARSQVRESYAACRTSWELARHYRDEVVPLARQISEEMLLRYNGMLIGTLDLLADARVQVRSVVGALEALRDFWLAEADLQTVLLTGAPGAGAPGVPHAGGRAPAPAAPTPRDSVAAH